MLEVIISIQYWNTVVLPLELFQALTFVNGCPEINIKNANRLITNFICNL